MSQFRSSGAARGNNAAPELPIQMQLDLLVDGELDENQRRLLLRQMEELGNHAAVGWRELALRFIQRQVEKESVKQLMHGGNLVPVQFIPPPPGRGIWRRLKKFEWERPVLVAAGMLIAVTSAAVTVYFVQHAGTSPAPIRSRQIVFDIPAEMVGGQNGSIPVNVPLVTANSGNLLQSNDDTTVTRRNWVIQPDGADRAVVVPVNLTNVQVR